MTKESLELDFALDFYDITDDCGCSENLWCSSCLNTRTQPGFGLVVS